MNMFLKCDEEETTYYNLRFNHPKCQYFCMNRENNIRFGNGQALDKVTQSKYPGCLLSKTAFTLVEISRRISKMKMAPQSEGFGSGLIFKACIFLHLFKSHWHQFLLFVQRARTNKNNQKQIEANTRYKSQELILEFGVRTSFLYL